MINFNRAGRRGARAASTRAGATRNDSIVAAGAFVDNARNVSENYDFDAIRVSIQPFTADFRDLLFIDQPLGVSCSERRTTTVAAQPAWPGA